MPLANLVGGKLVHRLVAKGGDGKGVQPQLGVIGRRLVSKVVEISGDGLLDRVGADLARAGAVGSCGLLGLPEVQDGLAVGILPVVGNGERLDGILLLALILANYPYAAR